MIRSRTLLTILLAVAVLAGATVPAAAQSDDGGLSGLFDDDDDGETDATAVVGTALDWAGGVADRVQAFVSARVFGYDATADEAATDAQEEFNDHAGAFQAYANNRTDANTDADVLKLRFRVDGETATRYLTADVNGSDYTNASIVASTDRSADESCTLEGTAAINAAAELDRFRETFVAPNKTVTRGYLAEMAGRYGGSVSCSFNISEP